MVAQTVGRKQRLKALENRVLTKTFELTREEAAENWRKSHIRNFKLLTLANIIRMAWVDHVTRTRHSGFWSIKINERDVSRRQ